MGIRVKGDSTGFVVSQLAHISHKADTRLATVGYRKGRTVPLTHHVFGEDLGWISQPSAPHPTLSMITTSSTEDHDQFGHSVSDISSMTSFVQILICDTGCMSAAIPPMAAYRVGFKRKDFRMNGAARGALGAIGAVVMQFHMVTEAGQVEGVPPASLWEYSS